MEIEFLIPTFISAGLAGIRYHDPAISHHSIPAVLQEQKQIRHTKAEKELKTICEFSFFTNYNFFFFVFYNKSILEKKHCLEVFFVVISY